MAWRILLVLLLEMAGVAISQILPTSTAEPATMSCQPITEITVCENVGYSNASFPNFRNQMTPVEANAELNNFIPLIRLNCSGAIVHMLCAVYAPYCTIPFEFLISPCKNLCEHVRSGCEDDLLLFGLQWPPALACEGLPSPGDPSTICFGPPDPSDLRIPPIDGVVIVRPTDPDPDPSPTPTDPTRTTTEPTPRPTDLPTLPPDPDSELCLPQQIARVSIRAVLIMSGGSDSAASDQCPATQGLQSTFTQFLRDQILVTSFRSGCTFLTTKLSSCVTRDQRTTAMVSADFTCNGPCIQGNTTSGASSEILDANRQLLMDTIAKEWTISTTFGDGRVRIIYFKRGQQSTITAVCGASAAEDNLCNCPATCPPSSSLEEELRNALAQLDQVTAQVNRLTQQFNSISTREAQVEAKVDTLSTTVEAITNRLDNPSSLFVGATLSANLTDVQLYNSCTTVLASTCTVPLTGQRGPTFSLCETANTPINSMNSYTVGAICATTDSNNIEVNPIVTTLQIDNILGVMQCRCWVIVSSDVFQQTQPVTCGLFITQCPVSQDLATSIQY